MKIEHLSMYVNDLEIMKEFYIKYFEATANDMYHNPRTGLQTYFLSFKEGARLEIMTRPDRVDSPKEFYATGFTHLAFTLGSKEKVDEMTSLMAKDGFKVLSGPRMTGDGYYESCFLDPEGNQIEIVA